MSKVQNNDPARRLASGERYSDAVQRVGSYGFGLTTEVRRKIMEFTRKHDFSLSEAEDEVYGNLYSPGKYPRSGHESLGEPTIEWADGRAEVEDAKTDVAWLAAALNVKLPPGVGKPSLLTQLKQMRESPVLLEDFYRLLIRRQMAVCEPAAPDRSLDEILRDDARSADNA